MNTLREHILLARVLDDAASGTRSRARVSQLVSGPTATVARTNRQTDKQNRRQLKADKQTTTKVAESSSNQIMKARSVANALLMLRFDSAAAAAVSPVDFWRSFVARRRELSKQRRALRHHHRALRHHRASRSRRRQKRKRFFDARRWIDFWERVKNKHKAQLKARTPRKTTRDNQQINGLTFCLLLAYVLISCPLTQRLYKISFVCDSLVAK